MENLLTPEEAARRLSVSPKGVKNWLRQGKLRGFKVGRLWRIAESDLQVFLVSSRSGALDARDDETWLESDLSGLGRFDPYDWGPQGPPTGSPVQHVSGRGLVVEDGT